MDEPGIAGALWRLPACLALALALAMPQTGCVQYAYRSARDSYTPPDEIAARAAEHRDREIVLLITGSMIVAEYFDLMRDRLAERGYWPVVYQPEELFTEPLVNGVPRVAEVVEKVVAANGGKPIKVIAECDGGIITRRYIEMAGGHQNIERFVSFVSAHNGTTGFPTAYFPALADIKPDSEFMAEMRQSRLPTEARTRMVSIYTCHDEVMKPHTTSKIPDAINIEICDEAFAERARKRKPPRVHHGLGQSMIPMYRQHFAAFWDEVAFELFVLALEGDEEAIHSFELLDVSFAR
jgi:Palmitoyl protein thioesterase